MNRPAAVFSLTLQSPDGIRRSDSLLLPGALHPEIAQALLEWARTVDSRRPLAVDFVVAGAASTNNSEATITVRDHFLGVAENHSQRIRDIFRYARVTSAVGLLVVLLLLGGAQAIPDDAGQVLAAVRESLTIFAWVAMWKPAELWLYAHWPERHWRRLALRLAQARISVIPGAALNAT